MSHIHGTLDKDMILGVNDVTQIKNRGFHSLENIGTYIKPDANDKLGNHKNTNATKLLNDANIYCIYGMSLGRTDKKWWIEIGKQLIIYVHDTSHDDSFPEHTFKAKDYYSTIFLNHLRFSELDKDDLREKIKKNIHIVINREIFKMQLVKPVKFYIEPFRL